MDLCLEHYPCSKSYKDGLVEALNWRIPTETTETFQSEHPFTNPPFWFSLFDFFYAVHEDHLVEGINWHHILLPNKRAKTGYTEKRAMEALKGFEKPNKL